MNAKARKTERRIVAALAALLDNEKAETEKIRRIAWAMPIGGGILLGVAMMVFSADSDSRWLLGAGVLSGLLVGSSVLYHSALVQWPVIRRFLDAESIRQEHAKNA